MIRVSRGNSERKAGGRILLFLLILSLATLHSGCAGVTSGSGDPPPTPPTLSMISPTSGATVSASTTVSANTSANTVGVQFKLDGTNLGSERTSTPFSISWDTTTTANGQHTLTAVARNATGQTATSAPVTVTVQNSASSTPPVISGVSASPGSTSASIFWTTDTLSDSQVDYGATVAYGQSSPLDSTQVTGHSASLSGLAASSLYHYRVKSKDAAGRLATSGDSTFTTLPAGAQGSLATLAAAMAPGTWAVLNTNNYNVGTGNIQDVSNSLSPGFISQWTQKGVWDPIHKQFLFFGTAHCGSASGTLADNKACRKFIRYRDDTNTWESLPDPSDAGAGPVFSTHAFEHHAMDPATGTLYHHICGYQCPQVWKYDTNTGIWSGLPNIPVAVLQSTGATSALTWFPDMNGLVFVDIWGVALYNLSTNTWSSISGSLPFGQLNYFATYDAAAHAVIFGGGDNSLHIFKLSSSGVVTALRDAPIPLGILNSVIAADPVSGKTLVWQTMLRNPTPTSYEYDAVSDTWRLLPGVPPIWADTEQGAEAIAAPVTNYGVVMFATYNFGQSKVYLYKHTR